MATNRFGYSDDFVLKNGKVGINNTEPQEKLDVVGGIVKGQDLKVTGVSSFTTYEGFLEANHTIDESITLTSGTSGSLSGEIIVGTGVTATVSSAATSSQGNIDSLKVYNTFTVPTGGTEDRPIKVKPGQLYYNVDFKTIEFWDGNNWRQVDNTTRSGRAVFGGGYQPGPVYVNSLDYVNINTLGNSQNFGDLTGQLSICQACGSETRGLYAGDDSTSTSPIEYITLASQGNSIDFGNLSALAEQNAGSCSSSTRGIWGGRSPSPGASSTVKDYVQISTNGNALDFGDLKDHSGGRSAVSSEIGEG